MGARQPACGDGVKLAEACDTKEMGLLAVLATAKRAVPGLEVYLAQKQEGGHHLGLFMGHKTRRRNDEAHPIILVDPHRYRNPLRRGS